MFDIISKDELWLWLNSGWADVTRHDLKGVQDAYIMSRLHDAHGCRILEIGGGNSRVLRALSEPSLGNECWNVDGFEGLGNGPKEDQNDSRIRVERCYVGDFSPDLPDDYFDFVVSVSVVEHVASPDLETFFADSARVLRPGGLLLHAIDLYIYDENAVFPHREQSRRRIHQYLRFADRTDLGIRFRDDPTIDENVAFRCSYATNPDWAMNQWNQIVPDLRPVREIAQSVSIKAEWIKQGQG